MQSIIRSTVKRQSITSEGNTANYRLPKYVALQRLWPYSATGGSFPTSDPPAVYRGYSSLLALPCLALGWVARYMVRALSGRPECSHLCFLELSVVANTTDDFASCALVIHAFVPSSTHSLPSRRAVVIAAPTGTAQHITPQPITPHHSTARATQHQRGAFNTDSS